ncbi:hypothetical protein DL95DRAFT_390532 [Leptodontidium sp. 2 PMI_412]|nr:hypothetical protein DL95DRAFT_390532 [Leptodontidium sp. 2 PMI_412]
MNKTSSNPPSHNYPFSLPSPYLPLPPQPKSTCCTAQSVNPLSPFVANSQLSISHAHLTRNPQTCCRGPFCKSNLISLHEPLLLSLLFIPVRPAAAAIRSITARRVRGQKALTHTHTHTHTTTAHCPPTHTLASPHLACLACLTSFQLSRCPRTPFAVLPPSHLSVFVFTLPPPNEHERTLLLRQPLLQTFIAVAFDDLRFRAEDAFACCYLGQFIRPIRSFSFYSTPYRAVPCEILLGAAHKLSSPIHEQ